MRVLESVNTLMLLCIVAAKPVPQVVDTCKESPTGYGSSYTNSSSSMVVAGGSSSVPYGTLSPLGLLSYTITLHSGNGTLYSPTGTGLSTITLGPASTGSNTVPSTGPLPYGPPSAGYSLPPYNNGSSLIGPTGGATSYPLPSRSTSYVIGTGTGTGNSNGFTPKSPVTTANSTIPSGTAPTPYANYTTGTAGASASGFSVESANATTTAHITSFLTTEITSFITGESATSANATGYFPTASPSSLTGFSFSFSTSTPFVTGGPISSSIASTGYGPAPYGSPSNASFTGDATGTGVSSSSSSSFSISAFTTSTVTVSSVALPTNTPIPYTSAPGGPAGYGPPGYYSPPSYHAPSFGEGGTDSGWFGTWFAKRLAL